MKRNRDGRADSTIANINVQMHVRARVIEGRWRGAVNGGSREPKGDPQRGEGIGCERNLIYRRLRSVIGL